MVDRAPVWEEPVSVVHGHLAAPDSPLASMHPFPKLCAVLATVVMISTFPSGPSRRPMAVASVLIGIWVLSRVPFRYVLRRFFAATPFIAMAAALPLVSAVPDGGLVAVAVGWKAYSAILLLSILAATTPVEDLVASLRLLGAPRGLALTATLMHRYLFVLLEEWRRVSRARDCRIGRGVRTGRTRTWAHQAAMVFVRGWDRADRVAHAMLARGFRGEFPKLRRPRPCVGDVAWGVLLPAAVLVLRVV